MSTYDTQRKESDGAANAQGDASAPVPGKQTLTGQLAAQQTMTTLAPGFGQSFDDVSVHTGDAGDARAQAHGSKAVTEGSNIYLSAAVEPESSEGHLVMAHEMAHVAQQRGAATSTGASGDRNGALEHDAHQVAKTVAAGGSASPSLRAPQQMAQGYGSPEHQSMGNDVHGILERKLKDTGDPMYADRGETQCTVGDGNPFEQPNPNQGQSRMPMFGGVGAVDMENQQQLEAKTGISQTAGLGPAKGVDRNGEVGIPRLAQMLDQDPFQDRARSLTLSLRNYSTSEDVAGVYLALQTDPTTGEAIRYDVPASPGDLTALNGDLYGSMENLRKAPVDEFVGLQKVLEAEASWERQVAAGTADPKKEPNFDDQWEQTTAWRHSPVYDGGTKVGKKGEAAGGDTGSYYDLALGNRAHFGEETQQKNELEITVHAGNLEALDRGKQGNFANGNEQAWMNGHARALRLASEAFAMRLPVSMPGLAVAATDNYGHERQGPAATGLSSPTAGNAVLQEQQQGGPTGIDGRALKQSSHEVTPESKLNDAYVENAGANHYLTDAFAAGHNIVRDVVGKVMDDFVNNKGGRPKFLDFVVSQLQTAATRDPEKAEGTLGKFQSYSNSMWWFKRSAARGDGWLNVFGDGMKQQLSDRINDETLHAIGAKIVHDYYNDNGLLVHNHKGMTFMTMGDGNADKATQAREIIALAVLESRTQITELAQRGITPNPMDVWDYTPDFDKTAFTQINGPKILDKMFSDPDRLWHLVKDHFSANPGGGDNGGVDNNITEKMPRRGPMTDFGTPPVQSWLRRRQAYVKEHGETPHPQYPGPSFETVDHKQLPGADEMNYGWDG